jgi:hypothetical protein
MKAKNQKQATDSLSLPGTESCINKFIAMYRDKSNDDFKKLIGCVFTQSICCQDEW